MKELGHQQYGNESMAYGFPIATVTDHHKCGGLKSSCSPGGQESEMHVRASSLGVSRAVFFSGSSRGKSISCLFQLLEASRIP